jgi:hypothetical protein
LTRDIKKIKRWKKRYEEDKKVGSPSRLVFIVLKLGRASQPGTQPTWGWNPAELMKNRKSHDPV